MLDELLLKAFVVGRDGLLRQPMGTDRHAAEEVSKRRPLERTPDAAEVARRGEFADVDDLAGRIIAFIKDYNRRAAPFRWTYDRRP